MAKKRLDQHSNTANTKATRLLCVRISARLHRALRTMAVCSDKSNADVVSEAIELLFAGRDDLAGPSGVEY